MNASDMFYSALMIVACAIGTVVVGRVWLTRPVRRRHAGRGATRRCETHPEEDEAVRVLQRVKELLPDLDLNMMNRQVHP